MAPGSQARVRRENLHVESPEGQRPLEQAHQFQGRHARPPNALPALPGEAARDGQPKVPSYVTEIPESSKLTATPVQSFVTCVAPSY